VAHQRAGADPDEPAAAPRVGQERQPQDAFLRHRSEPDVPSEYAKKAAMAGQRKFSQPGAAPLFPVGEGEPATLRPVLRAQQRPSPRQSQEQQA
jgi:hypothetical protein